MDQHGIAFRQQDNAFLDCANPQRLQELADGFGPTAINQAMDNALNQWLAYFTPEERAQGYRHQAFCAQVEYCDNLIFHSQRYQLTTQGYRVAILYSKIYHRLLAPLTAASLEPIPKEQLILNNRLSKLDRLYRILHDHLDRLTAFLGLAA